MLKRFVVGEIKDIIYLLAINILKLNEKNAMKAVQIVMLKKIHI